MHAKCKEGDGFLHGLAKWDSLLSPLSIRINLSTHVQPFINIKIHDEAEMSG